MAEHGAQRRARTTRGVYLADRAARVVITAGGWAVIAAVMGICLYLLVVTLPLFRGAETGRQVVLGLGMEPGERLLEVDEYATTATVVDGDRVRFVAIEDGRTLLAAPLHGEDARVRVLSRTPGTDLLAVGLDSGAVRLGTIGIRARVAASDAPPEGEGVVEQRLDDRTVRRIEPFVDLGAPEPLAEGQGAVRLIDYRQDASGRRFLLALREDGTLVMGTVRLIRPLGGGEPRIRISSTSVRIEPPGEGVEPTHAFVMNDGSDAVVLFSDGTVRRYAVGRTGGSMALAETRALGEGITDAAPMLGSRSLVVGFGDGRVRVYAAAADPAAETPDGRRFVRTRDWRAPGPVEQIVISARDRVVASVSGPAIRVVQGTSGKVLADLDRGPLRGDVALSPRNSAVVAADASAGAVAWPLESPHPEVSWRALFGPVVYEGEREAGFVYQSSSGSDEAELKYSLVPLIWGTLKATVVAMLFATPLAILAAIYTSEFMHPRWRKTIKPGIEMMASVPSVVLGFLAAMLLAPLVRDLLPGVLVGLIVTPFVVLLAAELWQVLPAPATGRTASRRLMAAAALSVAAGVGASAWAGGVVERSMFAPDRMDILIAARSVEAVAPEEVPEWFGQRSAASPEERRRLRSAGLAFQDGRVVRPVEPSTPEARAALAEAVAAGRLDEPGIRRWLDGTIGGPWPGWLALLLAPSALVSFLAVRRIPVSEAIAAMEYRRGPAGGVVSLVRFVLGCAATVALAALGATLLTRAGFDTRESIFGTFSQRNTLVVGLVMGFAVIPIIYSISEDALSSVPNSLRSASLGAGATRWQTARRIVLPVAASGVFSACMIGLGRAVGETMIVLMATGNTPEISANIFAGFRTLAANIAVELPEAPKDSTHFRVLFLCGLALFAMTFLINTTAEIVRLRFRRRSSAL